MAVTVRPDKKVIDDLLVKCYEVDSAQRLKPTAFMDMAQEMAYQAAAAMKFGYDELIVKNMAWVLSRMRFRFLKAPVWGEEVEIRTWHRGAFGPFFVRDFEVLDKEGRRMIEATSSWVIIDVDSRRMARPEEVLPKEDTSCPDFAIETPAGKVMMPRGVEPELVTTHKVAYSDIDLVGHTNNARYVAWALDCLEYGESGIQVEEVEIVFHHEARPGEEISLYRAQKDGWTFVEGRREDVQVFCVRIRNI
ncbi:MAG: hypothetical protein IJK32_08580 [Bacteroidales bacterium]|nr:hypothetical protein [Bacteroidales bacterium]